MANTVPEGMNAIHTNTQEGANPQFCDGTTDDIPCFQLTGRYGKPQPTNDFPYYTARSVPAIYTVTTDLKVSQKTNNIRQLLVRNQETSLQVANSRTSPSFSNNLVQNNFRDSELCKNLTILRMNVVPATAS